MDYTLVAYAAYLLVSVGVTVWVARTLVRHGRHFLVDAFAGNEALADAVNHLLAVGFYLVNLGFVANNLRAHREIASLPVAVEVFADQIGAVLLTVGALHFFNLWLFNRIRRKALAAVAPPPVLPNEFLRRSA